MYPPPTSASSSPPPAPATKPSASHSLVDEGLAACVNILPGLTSTYRWKGEVETAPEILLLIKTTTHNLAPLEEAIRRLHSYEVPEFLVLHPESASKPYLKWLFESTNPPTGTQNEK